MERITVSIAEAQSALGVGRTTLFRLLSNNQLEKIKIGRRTLVTVASIKALAKVASEHSALK